MTRAVALLTFLLPHCPTCADPVVIEGGGSGAGLEAPPQVVEVSSLRVREGQRLLVDLRAVLEALGWSVAWAPAEQTISARQGEARIIVKVNSATARVNDRELKLQNPARMLWHRIYAPVGLVAEVMRARVEYLGDAVRLTAPEGATLLIHLLG